MKCPNCKKEIENGSTFCEYCGARIKKSKKGLLITLSVVFVAIITMFIVNTYQINQYESKSGYVDLGLPSGTLWKKVNEGTETTNFGQSYYTYNEAVNRFGNQLPSLTQWEELQRNCTWSWTGEGYSVIGVNGNAIYLPAVGFRESSNGNVFDRGYGYYWSSTHSDSEYIWTLNFSPAGVGMGDYTSCYDATSRYPVRLVQ